MNDGTNRRLAAIVSADVVGYSRLMGVDEVGTHARLRSRYSQHIEPLITSHGGRVVKLMGDGILLEFASAVDAVIWSIEVQRLGDNLDADLPNDERIIYRIGINLGDVIADGDDIFGDDVNVAARMQVMAQPGGICLSDKVHSEIRGKLNAEFVDGGSQTAKNIKQQIHTWHWSPSTSSTVEHTAKLQTTDSWSRNKPSIAVLPFNNLSSDPQQEFFADGMVEDLITALSRFPWLFVIARNSSFSYKGQHVPIKQVATDLGVRYVVEGSVRSSAERLRVSVQLIDASYDHHVWADNYDREAGDLFDLQDEITRSLTGVLIPALSVAEQNRAVRDSRPSLDAWQAYQKGLANFYSSYSDENDAEARRLFNASISADESFSDAHAMIALMNVYVMNSGLSSYKATAAELMKEALSEAQLAVEYEDRSALAHLVLGRVYGQLGEFKTGIAECEMAVKLNPNFATAHFELGFLLTLAERYEQSIPCFDEAIRLSPNDPSRWNFYLLKGCGYYGMNRFEDAIICVNEAARLRPKAFWPPVWLAASYCSLGQTDEAKDSLADALRLKPDLNAGFFSKMFGEFGKAPRHAVSLLDELLKIGLPK